MSRTDLAMRDHLHVISCHRHLIQAGAHQPHRGQCRRVAVARGTAYEVELAYLGPAPGRRTGESSAGVAALF